MCDALEFHVEGGIGHDVTSARPGTGESGVLLIRSEGGPIREQGVVVRRWQKATAGVGRDHLTAQSMPLSLGPLQTSMKSSARSRASPSNRTSRRSIPLDADMKHTSGPITSRLAEHPGLSIEHVETGPTVDVRYLAWRPEGQVLGTEGNRPYIRPVQQTHDVRERSSIRTAIDAAPDAHQAGADKYPQRRPGSEDRPRSDLCLGRKVLDARHPTMMPNRTVPSSAPAGMSARAETGSAPQSASVGRFRSQRRLGDPHLLPKLGSVVAAAP